MSEEIREREVENCKMEEPLRVFISQPMRGKSAFEIIYARNRALHDVWGKILGQS